MINRVFKQVVANRFLPVMLLTRAVVGAWPALAAVSLFSLLLINMVYSAPEPPNLGDLWRWATILLAFGLSCWNVYSSYRAYVSSGFLSMVGFLHTWAFVAFSFAALETTYRYDSLTLLYWDTATNDPGLLAATIMLGAFQALFFFTLGREPPTRVKTLAQRSRVPRPNARIAIVFLLLVAPFLIARFDVVFSLGLQGIVETMVTRTPYTDRLGEQQGGIGWLLASLFPIYFTPLLCLGVKHLVGHPSTKGAVLYLGSLVVGAAGAVITGGRSELVYILFVVLAFMYVQGYRRLDQFKLLIPPILVLGMVLFLVSQARHGADNALTGLAAGSSQVGYDYSAGDVTQTLGLGRFDAAVMILDNAANTELLWGKSYLYAAGEALNATFGPRIIWGSFLPSWRVSDEVMGPWIFGNETASALPSAPGELFLNFGFVGVGLGAIALGLVGRFLMRWLLRFDGPAEFAWVMTVWTLARFLSDESFLIAQYASRAWVPVVLLTLLLVKREASRSGLRNAAPDRATTVGEA